jgi:WD40 repeat protein
MLSQEIFPESFFFSIAINNYDDGFTNLKSPRNDVQGISEQLELSCNGFRSIVIDENKATKEGIELFLEEMITTANTNPLNRLIFYFAGHGETVGNNDGSATGYLIPKDGKPRDPKTWISMDWLVEYLNKLDVKHLLVVLDCCFAGSLEWAVLKWREVNSVPKIVYKQHFEIYKAEVARQIITSTDFYEKALDHWPNNDHLIYSPFAKAFIDGLKGAADVLQNGLITASGLAGHIRRALEKLGAHYQRPGFFHFRNHGKGEFFFFHPTRSLHLRNAKKPIKENNPFMGLEPYEQKDHDKFFGRDRVVDEILERIKNRIEEADSVNLLVITGVSGSGKSSVVKAGVVPALVKNGWNIAGIIRPGEKPIDSLQKISFEADTNKILLVIDQLEELVTLGGDKHEAADFMDELYKLLLQNRQWFVIATLRSDFQHLVKKGKLDEGWIKYRYALPWFTRQELKEIIWQPAINMAFTFEPAGLVDTIIDDVLQFPGSLPMLSVLLSVLFDKSVENKRNRVLHQEDYDKNIRGVSGALHTKLNGLLQENNENEIILKTILLRMINIEGGIYTKRKVHKIDLVFDDEEVNEEVTNQVNKLIKERIIHTVEGEEGCWEPVHDAVVRWEKIGTWIEEIGVRRIGIQKELENAIEIYKRNGHNNNDLWYGNDRIKALVFELTEEKGRKSSGGWMINKSEGFFIELSEKIISSREKVAMLKPREANNQLALDYWNNSISAREKNNFLEALHFTAEALNLTKDEDLTKNLLIDIEAFLPAISLSNIFPYKLGSIRSAVFSPDGKQILTVYDYNGVCLLDLGSVNSDSPILKPKGRVYNAVFSPDGKKILTLSDDGTARLWNVILGRQIGRSIKHIEHTHYGYCRQDDFTSAAFSPDGKQILTFSDEDTTRLWNISTQKQVGYEMKHKGYITGAVFSVDGKHILTSSSDKTVRFWDAASGKRIGREMKHENEVASIVFSFDGKHILTASETAAQLWEAGSGKQIPPAMKHKGQGYKAIFSPDGKKILTIGQYESWVARNNCYGRFFNGSLWDVGTKKKIGNEMHHDGYILGAVFSPEGKWVLTAGDQTARLWDAITTNPVGFNMKHQRPVSKAVFSPDGKQILTACNETVRLWSVATETPGEPLMKHEAGTYYSIFSPDGQYILTVSRETARVWSIDAETPVGSPIRHESYINSAVFSPDGKWILTTSDDKSARVWVASTGKPNGPALKHQGVVYSGVFSPNGKQILTSSHDSTARLWTAGTEKSVSLIFKHGSAVRSAGFSPDGKQILTTCADGTARLWDVSTRKPIGDAMQHDRSFISSTIFHFSAFFSPNGKQILTLSDKFFRVWEAVTGKEIYPTNKKIYQRVVQSAVFSHDAKYILTTSKLGNNALLWDAATLKPIGRAMKHRGAVRSAVFSPDGKRILTASDDNTARIWDTGTGQQTGPAIKHDNRVISAIFSPDSKQILTASEDNTTRLWEAETGRQIGHVIEHGNLGHNTNSHSNKKQVLKQIDDSFISDLKGDLDLPADLFKLQIMVVTGCELNIDTNQVVPLQAEHWHKLNEEYKNKAREHYKTCNYPEHNFWRRFFPEEARMIRPNENNP